MALDLSSLQKAVDSLQRAINVASSLKKENADKDNIEVVRAGVIQNFEFTYELCWKFMKRWLEINGEGASVDGITRKELFRIAAERRLIENVEAWFAYTESRNETAHTYDPKTALDVFESAKSFLGDSKLLLKRLKEKND
jgi:nucleotidyltransferase substrate binding protein (TIGR01987 family)